MDCPPSLGVLTLNACTFATDIIIPLIAEVLPFKGLAMINEFISNVREFLIQKFMSLVFLLLVGKRQN